MDSIAHCLRKCKTETEIRVGMRQSCFWKGKIPLSAYADIPLFKGDMVRNNLPPLKREVARSAGGILTHCQAESARNCVSHPFQCRGEHRSPGSTPLPCRASPLKRRRFVKASSLEEVARSAGGVTHQRVNNVRPYRDAPNH